MNNGQVACAKTNRRRSNIARVVLYFAAWLAVLTIGCRLFVGQSAASQCVVSCCIVVPFATGGLCCLIAGCAIRRFTRSPHNAAGLTGISKPSGMRMDIPILTGMTIGVIAACLISPHVCGIMCRMHHVSVCVLPTQVIIPGLLAASISSSIMFTYAFGVA